VAVWYLLRYIGYRLRGRTTATPPIHDVCPLDPWIGGSHAASWLTVAPFASCRDHLLYGPQRLAIQLDRNSSQVSSLLCINTPHPSTIGSQRFSEPHPQSTQQLPLNPLLLIEIMKFAIISSLILGALATPTVLEKKQSGPRAFNITSLTLNGSGCPPGSATYTLNRE
jgi:hypothetical protein